MRRASLNRDEPVVYLATVANEPMAELWASTLRAEGIAVMLKPLGPGFGAWGSTFSFEHELYVLESKHDAALAIIRDLEGPEIWDVPGEDVSVAASDDPRELKG